jgi:DNA polymerase-3 subunit chi
MTSVEFHTGLGDPVAFACRLLRKAFRSGARIAVTAPPRVISALDRELWVFDERDFVPHVRYSGAAAPELLRRTPLWLVDGSLPEGVPPVVVNIDAPLPDSLTPVSRLIELVGDEGDVQERARERWRHYKSLGLPIVHHVAGDRRER